MILVTGGTGYIGSHTVVELLNQNKEVIVLDSLVNSDINVVDKIKKISSKDFYFEKLDLCDFESLNSVFQKYSITSVIHFAAFKAVGESVQKPLMYYRNNLLGLINLLDCCAINKVQNFVFSSSCTVYGEPKQMEISETAPVAVAESPYGNTKKIGEEIIRDMVKASSLRSVNLRYFNPIGAHKSGLLGDYPKGTPNNLVPYITRVAKGQLDCLNVFGGDYPTPDGTCIRDYIHVVDIAQAHVDALQLLEKMNLGECEEINLGTGKGNSVLEVIQTFEKATGIKIKYKISPRRPGDIMAIYANTNKAKEKLNWTAKLNLEDMLFSAWNFEKMIE